MHAYRGFINVNALGVGRQTHKHTCRQKQFQETTYVVTEPVTHQQKASGHWFNK